MLNLESDCTEKGRYSRMMPPPGLQVDVWPCATLIFDILTRKVDRFIPLPRGLLVPFCIKIGSFVRFQNVVFISLVTAKRTNKQTNERTNEHDENVFLAAASLAWWTHKNPSNFSRLAGIRTITEHQDVVLLCTFIVVLFCTVLPLW